MEILERNVKPGVLGFVVAMLLAGGAFGCGGPAKHVQTSRYTLSHPEFWKIKAQGQRDGEPTIVSIGQFGEAVIDDGAGALVEKERNYESVTAEVEVRVYGWAEPAGVKNPTDAVYRLLGGDKELMLPGHLVMLEHPPECGMLKKRYRLFGVAYEPLDLLRQPGFRTIVVGGTSRGVLLGVVSRIEYEQDVNRHCHNVRNMQVQLQNLLDGLTPIPGGGSGAGPAPVAAAPVTQAPGPAAAAASAETAAPTPTPASGESPPSSQ